MRKLIWLLLLMLSINFVSASLIAGYDFNDDLNNLGSGTTLDLTTTSGTGYIATYPTYATSGDGSPKGYDIAGDVNKIPFNDTMGSQLNLASSTISLWTKADVNSVGTDGYVFRLYSSGNDFVSVRRESTDNDLYFMVRDATTFFADTKILEYDNNQTWIHIAMVLNSTDGCQVYIDAVEVLDDSTCKGLDDVLVTDMSVTGYSPSALPLEGVIDDFHIYNTELTTTQISNLYNYGNITAPPVSSSSASSLNINKTYLNSQATGNWSFTNSSGGTANEQSNVTWYVNGAVVHTQTNVAGSTTLNEGNFTEDDSIIMQITPYDGVAAGTAVNSSARLVDTIKTNVTNHDANILHGTKVDFNLTLTTDKSNDITAFNSIIFEFNNTNTTVTYSGVYTGSQYNITAQNVQMPNITSLTQAFNYTWYVNYTAEGNTYLHTFTNTSTLSLFGIDDCSTYTIIWANFSIRDETNDSLLTGDLNAFFEYTADDYSNVYNISETNSSSFDYCLHPDWANETVDMLVQYSSTGYESRDYIAESYTLDNVTDQISLYTILTTLTTDITVGISDGADNPLDGILIYAEKYDIGTNTYTLVESEYTDTNGEAIFQLTFNQDYYRFLIYQDGVLQITTDRFKIFTTTYDYVLSTAGSSILEEYLSTKNALTHTLTYDTTSKLINLTYSESSASITNVCLQVTDINQTYYDSCDSTGSASLTYTITNTNVSYTARAYYETNLGNEYTFDTYTIPATTKSDVWGQNLGLAVSVIVFLCISLLGLGMGIQNRTSVNAVMILSAFAIILLKVFGFLPLGITTTVGTIGLIIAILVVLNKR